MVTNTFTVEEGHQNLRKMFLHVDFYDFTVEVLQIEPNDYSCWQIEKCDISSTAANAIVKIPEEYFTPILSCNNEE